MKPKVSLDFLRGALALGALRAFCLSGSGVWNSIAQWRFGHQQIQLFLSLGMLLMWGFILGSAFYPSRLRLQVVFALLAAMALMSILCQFYWLRNLPPFSHPYVFHYWSVAVDLAWAATAWLLYRRWPRT